MDLQKSFSKPFKKLKGKLPGGRRKHDGRFGNEDSRKGGEVDVEGSKGNLHSEVGIEDVVEGGPSRDGGNLDWKAAAPVDDPPTSTPSISQSGKPNSMWTALFPFLL